MAGAHVVGDAASRIEAALSAGCDMGLVCNDRAAAELALSAAQRMKVTPSPRIARMRASKPEAGARPLALACMPMVPPV